MPDPTLLLHTCCAPCLTTAEEQVRQEFAVTSYWYNPNIYPSTEHDRRLAELVRFTKQIQLPLVIETYTTDVTEWYGRCVSYTNEPEGQRRCRECIFFRLSRVAAYAKQHGYATFGTTLTTSPHKNATLINFIGQQLAAAYDIPFLVADFKKKDGYLRSIALSKEYGLYRQNYCGCEYSLRDAKLTPQPVAA